MIPGRNSLLSCLSLIAALPLLANPQTTNVARPNSKQVPSTWPLVAWTPDARRIRCSPAPRATRGTERYANAGIS